MNPQQLFTHVLTAYSYLIAASSALRSPLLLLVRLYWGWSFFQTGKGKLMTHEQVTDFFASLHVPMPGLNAWVAGAVECFGGLLLLLGLGSRLTAIPLIFTMVVAYLTADFETVQNLFIEPDKFTEATPFLFLLACVLVLVFGPGAFSLDRLIAWKWQLQPRPIKLPVIGRWQTAPVPAAELGRV